MSRWTRECEKNADTSLCVQRKHAMGVIAPVTHLTPRTGNRSILGTHCFCRAAVDLEGRAHHSRREGYARKESYRTVQYYHCFLIWRVTAVRKSINQSMTVPPRQWLGVCQRRASCVP